MNAIVTLLTALPVSVANTVARRKIVRTILLKAIS